MRATFGLFVIATSALGFGDTKDAKKELEKFAGVWEIKDLNYNGKEHNLKFKFTFKGNEGVVEGNDQVAAEYARIKIKLDPSATPKFVDIAVAAGSQADATMEGIYEFKNEELRICAKVFGKDRPSEFAAPAGSSIFLMTLKRAGK